MPEAGERTQPKILLVDDKPEFLEIFKTKLTASGFEVHTASDGLEGVERAKEFHPDLVLMDVEMPKMNGVEALLEIKKDPACRDIRVLFLTALGEAHTDVQEINRRLSKEVGAVGYLKKEDDLDALVEYIRTFLP